MLPYCYLNLEIRVVDWKSKIVDFEKRQMFRDPGCQLIHSNDRLFLRKLGLIPHYGQLWNWVTAKEKEDTMFHIDVSYNRTIPSMFAINILLEGTPALTEWVDEKKCTEILGDTMDPIYKSSHRVFLGNIEADYSASINQNPMLVRVDIPHRVRRDLITNTRWSYSMRFVSNKYQPLDYQSACSLLKDFIF